jgi:hypothetical protein
MFGAAIAALVFWIMKIVEVAGIPEQQYRAAGTDKTVWVLVVVLVGWVGALIWQLAKRDDVLRARGLVPPPGFGPAPYWGPVQGPVYGQQQLPGPGPGYGSHSGAPFAPGWGQPPVTAPLAEPGWYPEPGSDWSAFWDGYRWTGARRPPEQQPARPDLQKHPD